MPRFIQNTGDGYSFPLGISYISAAMKKHGLNVYTINLNHHEGNIKDILYREIKNNKIDVVLTGGLSFQYNTLKNIVDSVYEIDPNIIQIVGGGIITSDPTTSMTALEYVKYGVIGEGEITICELADVINSGKSNVDGIDGLIYSKGGIYQLTGCRKEIEDLDSIPWPDYDGFNMDEYLKCSPGISGLNNDHTVFMISSRSCPFSCTFCFHTVGKKYRVRSMDGFFKELDYVVNKYKVDYICFADELFSARLDRAKQFCDRMKNYNIKWWAQFRVCDITPEVIDLLKDSNCSVMSFGLESADNHILKSMKKHITVEQTERALKLVYDAGLSAEGAFIFGDVEETTETANNTLNWWLSHPEYKINLSVITTFPGTALYHYACENGIIKDKIQFLKDGCPPINVSKLTNDEYANLLQKITEYQVRLTKIFREIDIKKIHYSTGRIDFFARCSVCDHYNEFTNIKLFTFNFVGCKRCGQKYNVLLPPNLKETVLNHIETLSKSKRIGIYGLNYHAADLFKGSSYSNNVWFIDDSNVKQNMPVDGKKVVSSDIIGDEDLDIVIICVPVYFSQIEAKIRRINKTVKIISILDLLNPQLSYAN